MVMQLIGASRPQAIGASISHICWWSQPMLCICNIIKYFYIITSSSFAGTFTARLIWTVEAHALQVQEEDTGCYDGPCDENDHDEETLFQMSVARLHPGIPLTHPGTQPQPFGAFKYDWFDS